jgi:hypothetical protein
MTSFDFSCDQPFHLLQHVFVFASGDPRELNNLAVASQAATGETLEEINKQVGGIHFIANAAQATEMIRTGKPDRMAIRAMFHLVPTLSDEITNGTVQWFLRTGPDSSGQDIAIFFLYEKA